MIKVCLHCEKEFKTRYRSVNHCSQSCANRRNNVTLKCDHCGKTFKRPSHRIKSRQVSATFCSRDCHQAWKRARMTPIPCEHCEKAFYPRGAEIRHCSRKCQNESAKKHAVQTCENCNKTFETFPSAIQNGRRFCSEACARHFMVGKNSGHWRGGKELAFGRNWQSIRDFVRERDKVCHNCNVERSPSGRQLDVHHIKGRRYFEFKDESNMLDNLVCLCGPCHGRLEMALTHGHVERLPTRLKALASIQQSSG